MSPIAYVVGMLMMLAIGVVFGFGSFQDYTLSGDGSKRGALQFGARVFAVILSAAPILMVLPNGPVFDPGLEVLLVCLPVGVVGGGIWAVKMNQKIRWLKAQLGEA